MSFSHLDEHGAAHMVDVTDKSDTVRLAVAEGSIHMQPQTIRLIGEQGISKGDVFAVGRLAGIMGAKETSRLIPLCHPIFTTSIHVELSIVAPDTIRIEASVRSSGRTGPEMEALTGVSLACLAVYDMCKSIDDEMVIGPIQLLRKSGGKSGDWHRPQVSGRQPQ